MTPPAGLLVLNLGGPADLAQVKPFLDRLFADREIIRLPGGAFGQWLISRMIVWARLKGVKENYRSIGGGSPILKYTEVQVEGVARRLSQKTGRDFRPYIAFRYTEPSSDQAVRRMRDDGVREVVVLTLYPHYSKATTGSSLNELNRAFERCDLEHAFELTVIDRWYDHPVYLDVMAERVRAALREWPEAERKSVFLLFSAHSLPMSIIEDGDPYPEHIQATMSGILDRLAADTPARTALAYQSQTGPVPWLEPRTDQVVEELGREGVTDILVAPLSFVSDHIETLYEVDQLFAEVAREAGVKRFRRIESLNDDPAFLEALTHVVADAMAPTLTGERGA